MVRSSYLLGVSPTTTKSSLDEVSESVFVLYAALESVFVLCAALESVFEFETFFSFFVLFSCEYA